MPAGRLVVQMDHSFQWLQMHSHLTIHVGWILFQHQQNELCQENPVDFLFYLQ